ncbi:MAG: FRG domain-containing protein [Nitrospinae bacterium]|nr:FRG domain-containing protein [Nitrospinota bacterium]
MWGQWIGKTEGTNKGTVILNIDGDIQNEGLIAFIDYNVSRPIFYAKAIIEHNSNYFKAQLLNFASYPPNVKNQNFLPKTGEISGIIDNNSIRGNWKTDIDTSGSFVLNNYESDDYYNCDYEYSWDKFREWIIGILNTRTEKTGLIFRGHSDNKYNLRTTFHRTGRRDLLRYSLNDIPELARYISNITGKFYSLENPIEHGELIFLAQHHGYPTPLLDWTESPFIAAYFAFSKIEKYELYGDYRKVRIFIFDTYSWHSLKKFPIANSIADPRTIFSTHALSSRDNKRAMPQQSVSTFSNIRDIDRFIKSWEDIDNRKYITRIDIPVKERDKAMKELQYMGITAASLFPGIDGTCSSLKEKYFKIA